MLRRLDLCCQTIAPFAAGLIMQYTELGSAIFFLLWNLLSGFCEYFILRSIYEDKIPGLMKPKHNELISEPFALLDLDAFQKYRKEFLMPGISFGLVFLSILGFDSVTVGFINRQGREFRKPVQTIRLSNDCLSNFSRRRTHRDIQFIWCAFWHSGYNHFPDRSQGFRSSTNCAHRFYD